MEVEEFLKKNIQEIPDNGFTGKIMEELPAPRFSWSQAAQILCYIIVAAIMVFGGGIDMLNRILDKADTLTDLLINLTYNSLYIIFFGFLMTISIVYNYKDRLEM